MDGNRPHVDAKQRIVSRRQPDRDTRQRRFVDLELDPPDQTLLSETDIEHYLKDRTLPYRRVGAALTFVSDSETARSTDGTTPITEISRCSRSSFDRFLRQHFEAALTERAANRLFDTRPDFSARLHVHFGIKLAAILLGIAVICLAIQWPAKTVTCVYLVLLPYVSLSLGLKALLFWASFKPLNASHTPLEELPIVTILVPLRHESAILPALLKSLTTLDYPHACLDVKLLVESDDDETLMALDDLPLPYFMEVLEIPEGEPRTKPRAMNFALPFARGEYLAIFDAEDAPEPDQIRKAVAALCNPPVYLALGGAVAGLGGNRREGAVFRGV